MRKSLLRPALETIQFQNGQFFRDLVEEVKKLYGMNRRARDRDYYTSDEIKRFCQFIKDRTGIMLEMYPGSPGIASPYLSQNHIFTQDLSVYFRERMVDPHMDVRELIKEAENGLVKGHVDLVTARVHGVFEKIQIYLFMPRYMLESDEYVKPEVVAAIILHELGHTFTYFEYINRTVTTNQALSLMTRANDRTLGSNEREALFAKGADLLKMDDEQRKAALSAKNDTQLTVIVLDSAIELSRSELQCNIYDTVSCEFLADQFTARHGAARWNAIGLDTLAYDGGQGKLSRLFTAFIELIFLSIGIGFSLGLIFLSVMFVEREPRNYDRPYYRLQRLLLQNRERLKDRDISDEEKKYYVESSEIIERIMSRYHDSMFDEPVWDRLAYLLSSNYRRAYKYEKLQIELEKLATSGLFDKAAKLGSLGPTSVSKG